MGWDGLGWGVVCVCEEGEGRADGVGGRPAKGGVPSDESSRQGR